MFRQDLTKIKAVVEKIRIVLHYSKNEPPVQSRNALRKAKARSKSIGVVRARKSVIPISPDDIVKFGECLVECVKRNLGANPVGLGMLLLCFVTDCVCQL